MDDATTPADGEEPTVSPTDAPAGEISGVPVYYVGDSGGSFRLFREWRTVPDLGDPVESAVMAMMSVAPMDPDYSTPWVAPDELEVEREGSAITVDVSADAFTGSVGCQDRREVGDFTPGGDLDGEQRAHRVTRRSG